MLRCTPETRSYFGGNEVLVMKGGPGNDYINANKMFRTITDKAEGGKYKRYSEWSNSKEGSATISIIAKHLGKTDGDLVIPKLNLGTDLNGTYVHELLAVCIMAWSTPKYMVELALEKVALGKSPSSEEENKLRKIIKKNEKLKAELDDMKRKVERASLEANPREAYLVEELKKMKDGLALEKRRSKYLSKQLSKISTKMTSGWGSLLLQVTHRLGRSLKKIFS